MDPPERETDGGPDTGLDEQALYVVVRKAVEDAIVGAVGTLLLVGVGVWLVWFGAVVAVSGGSPVAVAAGIAVAVIGFGLAARALDVLPPIDELF